MFNIYKNSLQKNFYFYIERKLVEGIKAGEMDLQHPNQLGNAYIAKVNFRWSFWEITFNQKNILTILLKKKYPEY